MGKLAMDISSMNANPFFHMNNNSNSQGGQNNDDIILLQTTEDQSRGQQHNNNSDPDIIPISFGDTVTHAQGYNSAQQEKINLIVSEAGEVSDHQYRIIPEIMPDGTFHEETIDSCLSIFPGCSDPQELSPVKSQQENAKQRSSHVPLAQPNSHAQNVAQELSLPITGNQNTFQALFEAATSEYHSQQELMVRQGTSMVHTSPSATQTLTTPCSTPRAAADPGLPKTTVSQAVKPAADCALVDSKKQCSPGKSMSQGKLRVINQGIQSENIQSPSLAETRNKGRRRSGQASGYSSLGSAPPLCPSASPSLHTTPPQAPPPQLSRGQAGVRLLSVGAQESNQDAEADIGQIVSQESSSETESEAAPSPHEPGLSTPGLVPWPAEELWRGGGTGVTLWRLCRLLSKT